MCFATTLVRGGTDLVIAAELLGHARLETYYRFRAYLGRDVVWRLLGRGADERGKPPSSFGPWYQGRSRATRDRRLNPDARRRPVATIERTAALIDRLSRRIEDAVTTVPLVDRGDAVSSTGAVPAPR